MRIIDASHLALIRVKGASLPRLLLSVFEVQVLRLVRLLELLLGHMHAIILENLFIHLIHPALRWLAKTIE